MHGQGNGVIRTTTLFIVLTLTGTPAVSTWCIVWCGARGMTGTEAARCHERMTTQGALEVVASAHECDTVLQHKPFVREDLQPVSSGAAQNHAVVTPAVHNGGGGPFVDALAAQQATNPRGTAGSIALRI
jgi:hypothetical protein